MQNERQMKADYRKLKAEAKRLFMDGKSQKEIAEALKVSTVTLSTWSREGGWKAERDARLNNDRNRVENIRHIIGCLSEQKIKLLGEITLAEAAGDAEEVLKLRKAADSLADEVSKWNKSLQGMQTECRRQVTLAVYLEVMDSIFRDMQATAPELFRQSIDFQEAHVAKATQIYS